MEVNPPGDPYQLLRTTSGHIHMGYDNPNIELSIEIIKAMDLFLGVGSVLLDPDTQRRKMYGKAGCFRPKPYGFEWRSLSNFWTATPELVKWMFDSTMKAVEFVENNIISEDIKVRIVNCMNNYDKILAKELIQEFKMNEFTNLYDEYLVKDQFLSEPIEEEVKDTVQV